HICSTPCEVSDPNPFQQDDKHAAYDAEYAQRFWRILLQADLVFEEFRARFIGKCSPVHFFWGSFDLAVTRFSGRRAPARENADAITREAYSHEVSSVGFWPGDNRMPQTTFYSYASPEPDGYRSAVSAQYLEAFGGFYLPYDDVRLAADPDNMLP